VEGDGAVDLPYALERTYPNANRAWGWQDVFSATSRSVDPRTGAERRHHLDASRLQKAVRAAACLAGIDTPVTCHPFRHSCATHVLEAGDDIRTVQAWRGHQDVKTTMISTHVLHRGAKAVRSPLD
jgi:site-specific recombinase XerD